MSRSALSAARPHRRSSTGKCAAAVSWPAESNGNDTTPAMRTTTGGRIDGPPSQRPRNSAAAPGPAPSRVASRSLTTIAGASWSPAAGRSPPLGPVHIRRSVPPIAKIVTLSGGRSWDAVVSASPMRNGTAVATSGSRARARAVSNGRSIGSRDCGKPSDAMTRTSNPNESSSSRTETSRPRDSSSMSKVSAPAAAMPRMPRATRAAGGRPSARRRPAALIAAPASGCGCAPAPTTPRRWRRSRAAGRAPPPARRWPA